MHLAAGVPLLHPGEQVFMAMLDGWRAQQLARNLAFSTYGRRESMVRAFAGHADAMPWGWEPRMIDEWLGDMRGVRGLRPSTVRSYGSSVSAFCRYVTDPAYGWAEECQDRFGTHANARDFRCFSLPGMLLLSCSVRALKSVSG